MNNTQIPIFCSICKQAICNEKYTTPDGKIWASDTTKDGVGSIQIPVICRDCIEKGITL